MVRKIFPRSFYYMMICICAILPNNPHKGLLLQRTTEKKLSEFIKQHTLGVSFIFNTQSGIFIFTCADKVSDWLLKNISDYITQKTQKGSFIDTSNNHNFFRGVIRNILNCPDSSSLAWKNFMSSFLIQLNPFYGDSFAINSLFRDFISVIKEYGNEEQRCYLKKRMDILRSRVTLDISSY